MIRRFADAFNVLSTYFALKSFICRYLSIKYVGVCHVMSQIHLMFKNSSDALLGKKKRKTLFELLDKGEIL